MEYIYGNREMGGVFTETLKTVGSEHTALEGYISSVRDYGNSVITDNCHIVSHYESKEDDEGKCYDWYAIDCHYRIIDNSRVAAQANEKTRSLVEYVAMMTDVELPETNGEG